MAATNQVKKAKKKKEKKQHAKNKKSKSATNEKNGSTQAKQQERDDPQSIHGDVHKQPQDGKIAIGVLKRRAGEELEVVTDNIPRRNKKKRKKQIPSLEEAEEPRPDTSASKNDGQGQTITTPSIEGELKKRKKSKKNKLKKQKKKSEAVESGRHKDVDSDIIRNKEELNNASNSAGELEGCLMAGNEMVLIDRTNQIVYSGTERLANGDLKKIGTLNSKGEIVLFVKKELINDDKGAKHMNEDATEQNSPQTDIASQRKDESDISFPFETDPDDHCESPVEAYRDIVPLLRKCGHIDRRQQGSESSPSIYDPYFCNGAVIKNLESLGFPNVYNRKEDCYRLWDACNSSLDSSSNCSYPKFDVLVTNPPYSADHIEKLIEHVTMSKLFGQRPWFLLLPQFVHKKDYYVEKTRHIRPFYIVPHKRYVYLPPPAFRETKKSDVHKKSSPFVSMWYVWGGTQSKTEQLLAAARGLSNCDVARSKSALRDLRRASQNQKKRRK